MKKPDEFIFIDNEENCNFMYRILIGHAFDRETNVKTFTLADDGISYLKEVAKKNNFKTVMFLDINMPVTNGWEALNILEKLDDSIKEQLTIFMLSSSINPADKKRAMEHPLVFDFVEKPLTVDKILSIFNTGPIIK